MSSPLKTTEERTEATGSTEVAESSKMFLIRHLNKMGNSHDRWWNRLSDEDAKLWNIVHNIYEYSINPFLQKKNNIDKLIDNLKGKTINHVICSPFIRCIQTAILVVNSSKLTITNKIIHINFGLGETIQADLEFKIPVNMREVFNFSKDFITKNFNKLDYVLDDATPELVISKYETDADYDARILKVLNEIRETYSGNILIVTHGNARKQFTDTRSGMGYGSVYDIKLPSSRHKEKYIKYKTKYLQLKNKLTNS